MRILAAADDPIDDSVSTYEYPPERSTVSIQLK
jgi:hypothetical protein